MITRTIEGAGYVDISEPRKKVPRHTLAYSLLLSWARVKHVALWWGCAGGFGSVNVGGCQTALICDDLRWDSGNDGMASKE